MVNQEKPLRPRTDIEQMPLVSVIMFVRNGLPQLKRALNSVLTQNYLNFELIIQDGVSTDGTVEYISGLNDQRIKLCTEPDKGPSDAFDKALSRCSGEYIATCLADEELCPGALARIVDLFRQYPHLGAITGNAEITDIDGNFYTYFIGGPFNLLKYLTGEYCPYWCSSFFKMDALQGVGFFKERWSASSLEFEIWIRLALETDILYVPEVFSKYAHHEGQLSQNFGRAIEEMHSRLDIIRNKVFVEDTFFGKDDRLRDVACLLQLRNLYRHLSAWKSPQASKIFDLIVEQDYFHEFNLHRGIGSKLKYYRRKIFNFFRLKRKEEWRLNQN